MFKIRKAAAAAMALSVSSCTVDNKIQPTPAGADPKANIQQVLIESDGGDDDDPPVIVNVVTDESNAPVVRASITLVKNADTVTGFTNSSGVCFSQLTGKGLWKVYIAHDDFLFLSDTKNIVADTTLWPHTLRH